MLRQYLLFCLLSLAADTVFAQQFTAYTSEKTAVVNQPFEVVYTLSDINARDFSPPDFGTAKVISGPNQSTSTTIINGVTNSEITLGYTLMPTQTGTLNISPASVKAGGRTLRSNALRMEVKEGRKLDFTEKGDLPDVFVRLETNTDSAYTGQQILLDYRLYTLVDLQNINIVSESEYAGFFYEPLRRFNKNQASQTINGKNYVTQIIRRIALFPQQAGNFEIEPSQVTAQIVTGRRRSGFFTFADTKPVYLTTESVNLMVRSLPSGNAPAAFTGAVGDDFEVSVVTPRAQLTTDDALALRVTVRGNGDIKRVQLPKLDFGKNFEVYDPKVLQEENYENRGQLYGKKIAEYLVLPKKAGEYKLQADFAFFNPDSAAYQTAFAVTPTLFIQKGVNDGNRNINISPDSAAKDDTLRPDKSEVSFSSPSAPFFGSTFFWILTGLPFLGFAGAMWYKKKSQSGETLSPEEYKMQQAVRVARERLSAGRKYMEEGNSRAFYDEVSRAFLGYVGDKLQIPPARMSKANVRQRLEELRVGSAKIDDFIGILRTCETALFAGKDNSAAMSEIYQNAEGVIIAIEEELITDG